MRIAIGFDDSDTDNFILLGPFPAGSKLSKLNVGSWLFDNPPLPGLVMLSAVALLSIPPVLNLAALDGGESIFHGPQTSGGTAPCVFSAGFCSIDVFAHFDRQCYVLVRVLWTGEVGGHGFVSIFADDPSRGM